MVDIKTEDWQEVFQFLKENWPNVYETYEISEELDMNKEEARVCLFYLHRIGKVSHTGDWKWRSAIPNYSDD